MRLFKLLSLALLAVAALLGGFFVAAVIAGATVVAWVVRHLFFKPDALTTAEPAVPSRSSSDVIDVSATEVSILEDPRRLRSGS